MKATVAILAAFVIAAAPMVAASTPTLGAKNLNYLLDQASSAGADLNKVVTWKVVGNGATVIHMDTLGNALAVMAKVAGNRGVDLQALQNAKPSSATAGTYDIDPQAETFEIFGTFTCDVTDTGLGLAGTVQTTQSSASGGWFSIAEAYSQVDDATLADGFGMGSSYTFAGVGYTFDFDFGWLGFCFSYGVGEVVLQ